MIAENKVCQVVGDNKVYNMSYAPGNATLYEVYWVKFQDSVLLSVVNFGAGFSFPCHCVSESYVAEKLKFDFKSDARVISLLLRQIVNHQVDYFCDQLVKAAKTNSKWEAFEQIEAAAARSERV